jgi:threonine dehydrogenase-like Zn-dependent dehydrogenase
MRAIAVTPGQPGSAAVIEVPDPPQSDGAVLVRGRTVGICGTDAEIVFDGYGTVPAGADQLVLGHESLGEVISAPAGSGLSAGDLVSAVVRRPAPQPCRCCAAGEWDMCSDGRFVERGITGAPGYGSELWRADPEFVIPVDPALGDLGVLLETTSVVAKAWEHVDSIGRRASFEPQVAVITGAGPVGLLAGLLATQRGLRTWILDLATGGPKPRLVADLGASYSTDAAHELPERPDIVIECTGHGQVLAEVALAAGPNATIALTGLSQHTHLAPADLSAVNRRLVLGNQVIFGTVNAARRHYDQAADALARADPSWLARLLTRRVPMADWPQALVKEPSDIKVSVALDE